MGKNFLRQISDRECRWTDNTVNKHKHDFSIEACVELDSDTFLSYFHVMKCSCCSSFKCIPKERDIWGTLPERLPNVPLIKLYNSHKIVNFKGAVLKDNMHL